jgi:hypothetical protein
MAIYGGHSKGYFTPQKGFYIIFLYNNKIWMSSFENLVKNLQGSNLLVLSQTPRFLKDLNSEIPGVKAYFVLDFCVTNLSWEL